MSISKINANYRANRDKFIFDIYKDGHSIKEMIGIIWGSLGGHPFFSDRAAERYIKSSIKRHLNRTSKINKKLTKNLVKTRRKLISSIQKTAKGE